MEALQGLGAETWFQLGDGDLALHVERSWRLARGDSLSEVTAHLCRSLGIAPRVLPMSDDPVRTRVLTEEGWLDFQEYFVHRQCRPAVREFMFAGAETARAQPAALSNGPICGPSSSAPRIPSSASSPFSRCPVFAPRCRLSGAPVNCRHAHHRRQGHQGAGR